MISNRYILALKIFIVSFCSYSAFRLFIAPNKNKDLHLAVFLTCGLLAMFFDNGKRKYTLITNILRTIIVMAPLSYLTYRLLFVPNVKNDIISIWIVPYFFAILSPIWARKKQIMC